MLRKCAVPQRGNGQRQRGVLREKRKHKDAKSTRRQAWKQKVVLYAAQEESTFTAEAKSTIIRSGERTTCTGHGIKLRAQERKACGKKEGEEQEVEGRAHTTKEGSTDSDTSYLL